MDALPSDRYERVRESLLHLGLRQITEEPGPEDQSAVFARRRARFKKHRQELDNFRTKQSAARVAAEAKTDSELRARLGAQNGTSTLLTCRSLYLLILTGCDTHRPSRQAVAASCIVEDRIQPVHQMQGKTVQHEILEDTTG
jgi:hypothetical protein